MYSLDCDFILMTIKHIFPPNILIAIMHLDVLLFFQLFLNSDSHNKFTLHVNRVKIV